MLNFCFVRGSYVLFTLQGQCKPNAESLLYAEVQPVLALDFKGKVTAIPWDLKTKSPILRFQNP